MAWSLGAMKLDKQPTNPGDQAARQRVGLEENLELGSIVSSRCEYISQDMEPDRTDLLQGAFGRSHFFPGFGLRSRVQGFGFRVL